MNHLESQTAVAIPLAAVVIAVLVGCALSLACGCASIEKLVDKYGDRIDLPTEGDPGKPIPDKQTGDSIDLSTVVWHGPDIRAWAVTSEMQPPVVSGSDIRMPHSKAGQWPVGSINGTAVEANPWIVAKINGQWHAASWEWLRPGQVEKPWNKIEGGHIKTAPFDGWRLTRGEECYLLVSALARGSARTVAERTAARRVVWR